MPVTRTIYVDGPAVLMFGNASCTASAYVAPTDSSATELGITESGLQVSVNTMTHRVNSDDMGGGEGNPAEILIMGAQGQIRGTLVKYNPAAWGDLISGLNGGVGFGLPGTPLFAGGYAFSFWVVGTNSTLWFPMCEIASTPREFNFSTTERKTSFGVTAYPVKYTTQVEGVSVCTQALYFMGPGSPTAVCSSCPVISTGG